MVHEVWIQKQRQEEQLPCHDQLGLACAIDMQAALLLYALDTFASAAAAAAAEWQRAAVAIPHLPAAVIAPGRSVVRTGLEAVVKAVGEAAVEAGEAAEDQAVEAVALHPQAAAAALTLQPHGCLTYEILQGLFRLVFCPSHTFGHGSGASAIFVSLQHAHQNKHQVPHAASVGDASIGATVPAVVAAALIAAADSPHVTAAAVALVPVTTADGSAASPAPPELLAAPIQQVRAVRTAAQSDL